MRRRLIMLWAIVITLIIFALTAITFIQQRKIQRLSMSLDVIQKTKIGYSDCYAGYKDEAYNYLAIGNSITLHTEGSYWWNNCGMAASTPEKDYYHLLVDYLLNDNTEVCSSICNLSTWEMMDYDRDEALSLLNTYLSDQLDLVTIQLGENVDDISTFENDLDSLVKYIKQKATEAKIVIIGDFWRDESRELIKKRVAQENDCEFVDLSSVWGKKEYVRQAGDVVFGSDGKEHIVNHKGVLKHPNDTGMQYIAECIILTLGERNNGKKQ